MELQKLHFTKKLHLILLMIFLGAFIWSAIKPNERGTWFLEVTPIIVGTILILYTYNKFRLTTPVYLLLCFGSIIVLIGGHYTYGKVPLFTWLSETYHLGRNHYDRFAHLINGSVWALTLREILLRISPLRRGKLLLALILGLVLGLSAIYELIEWGVAVISGGGAEAFLGLQGDIWDTHWDMFLALLGALASLLGLSRIHDDYLAKELHVKP